MAFLGQNPQPNKTQDLSLYARQHQGYQYGTINPAETFIMSTMQRGFEVAFEWNIWFYDKS